VPSHCVMDILATRETTDIVSSTKLSYGFYLALGNVWRC
jgi:hypothetical protein